MPFAAQHIRAAQTQLKRTDQKMRDVIRNVGPFTLKPRRDYFVTLVRSIISQQISVAAARTILSRLEDHLQPHGLQAAEIALLDLPTLRSIGVSQQKAGYLLDLAGRTNNGSLDLKAIARKTDEQVIEHLTQVKGIGVWTAQMFLIFSLGRLDVLPTGDLGIQTAIKNQYGLRELPKPEKMEKIARPWRPYASVASWYLWQTLKSTPKD